MRKIIFIIFLISLIVSCNSKSKMNCKNFKTGKFFSHSTSFGDSVIINRNDSIQTETNVLNGHVYKEKIEWLNDCEYSLTTIEEAKGFSDTLKPALNGMTIITKILEVKENYCVYETRMSGVSMRMIDTLRILK